MYNFLDNHKLLRVHTGTIDGTTTILSDAVDTNGYLTATFFGTTTSGIANVLTVHSSGTSGGTYAALVGAAVTVTADGNQFAVECHKPVDGRWLKLSMDRTVSTPIEEVWCVLSNPRSIPVTQATTTDYAISNAPANA